MINKGIREKARKFLDGNPSTIAEAMGAVNNLYQSHLYNDRKVGIIGPRGHKVYYLIGQEELAKETLERNLKACSKEEKILNALTKPMTYGELKKLDGLKSLENKDIRDLEFEGKLMRL